MLAFHLIRDSWAEIAEQQNPEPGPKGKCIKWGMKEEILVTDVVYICFTTFPSTKVSSTLGDKTLSVFIQMYRYLELL